MGTKTCKTLPRDGWGRRARARPCYVRQGGWTSAVFGMRMTPFYQVEGFFRAMRGLPFPARTPVPSCAGLSPDGVGPLPTWHDAVPE